MCANFDTLSAYLILIFNCEMYLSCTNTNYYLYSIKICIMLSHKVKLN